MGIPAIPAYPMPSLSELPKNKVLWKLDPKRAVLLIHDMQNYFLDAFTPNASPLVELVSHIQQIKRECKKLGIPVVYSAQPGGQTPEERGLLQDFWGKGIADDSYQKGIIDDLAPDDDDIVLTKWRYSAFKKTPLSEILKEQGRDQLIICGVYAHIGCLLTASDAFMQDIQVFFIADAVADFSREHHQMAIQYAASRCAFTMSTQQLLDVLKRTQNPLPLSLEDVRRQVAELLQAEAADLSDQENLIDRGLDSIRIMSLVEKWRRAGAKVTFADLAARPTLSDWWNLLYFPREKVLSNQDA
ncbi:MULTISPECIES: isochorismatase family protein [Geobacillus]|jgi:bifunctional isochorismate lyase / aryl carrier protein|uniref:isochorismatase family protein n=1 Tax=Geobacillus TaxID=129337 RepID=UPI0003F5025E|nr:MULTISPECIES: isochorismatase family protein [Geobacillus]ARA98007.1 isochorismatase [Geobacillus thermodenitrificans]ARP41193.1 Vibriobactin-specific isochorismatase [Geobacillus thermodenitrificans]ATO37361.1 isochorismatase [Geobacillus thermodenitrificans]KQB94808.1 Isochorismatase [Geobacillus sp. PA-3]MED0664543.1 isochorismatase [Geobacillus thermodenitrificans]